MTKNRLLMSCTKPMSAPRELAEFQVTMHEFPRLHLRVSVIYGSISAH
jgi:hypothetical protein